MEWRIRVGCAKSEMLNKERDTYGTGAVLIHFEEVGAREELSEIIERSKKVLNMVAVG